MKSFNVIFPITSTPTTSSDYLCPEHVLRGALYTLSYYDVNLYHVPLVPDTTH